MRTEGFYSKFMKRPLDITASLLAIIMLSPVLLITALLVKVKLGSPVIFMQQRPGLQEKLFMLYKFRTMRDQRDEQGNPLPDELRLTRFGQWLRSTSLDELPELFNILKGDMSMVGPRPLLVQYLPLYNEVQRRRHEVRPGLSGLAQINGRNAISWEQKFKLDIDYVERITFMEDLRIIGATIVKTVCREGIHAPESSTMDVFVGTKERDEKRGS
ncbi:sugar transferase [Paenibacillus lemnae]|uniref:Sugar transferase n=2 Tax=Paenibacillus lemnae TaxID=1330551 RepID=A0A848M8U3_PAELE|nr:sugar transferase [Paenibacillus lemnae]